MAKDSSQLKRINIDYFLGVNTLVGPNIAKKEELEFAENARSTKIGTIEKRQGYRRLGADLSATANYGITYFESANGSSKHFWRVSTVGGDVNVYYLNTSDGWTIAAAGLQDITAANVSFTQAEGCLFLVNGTDANKQINADGTTIKNSGNQDSHLRSSPAAYKINYYKDRLYLGDYTNTTRYKTGIMRSSTPLGIICLVDGDHANVAIDDDIKVTDTKYILGAGMGMDVYRGGVKICDLTIDAKTENTITVSAVAFVGAYTDFLSTDELWVDNSYTGVKYMKWADNPKSGEDVKRYDTFKLSGEDNSALTMMENIGDVMLISNKRSMASWDDYRLINFDVGIGCVSDKGWIRAKNRLFFMGYDGIYVTTGGPPELDSAEMQRLFDGAIKSKLEAGAMGKKGFNIFASLGDVTLYNKDGSVDRVLSDVVIEKDLKTGNWYPHTGIDADHFANYYTNTDIERLEYCADGEVYEFLYGTKDANTDEIPFRIDTNSITLSKEFENICYPREIILETERGSALQCFVSLDGEDFYELPGEARKGCTVFKVVSQNDEKPARCRTISISVRDFSKTICTVSKIAIVFSDTPEQETHRLQYT